MTLAAPLPSKREDTNERGRFKPAFPAMSIEQAHAMLTAPGTPQFEVDEEEVRGVRMKVWENAPPTLRGGHAAGAAWAGRDHLVFENERATIGEFAPPPAKFAHQLIADGVSPGDRVAVIMRNVPEWPVAFWGAVWRGHRHPPKCVVDGSGTRIRVEKFRHIDRSHGHRALRARPRAPRKMPRHSQSHVSRARGTSLIRALSGWRASSVRRPMGCAGGDGAAEEVDLAPDDDVAIFYTSGTTGSPKAR